MRHSMCNAAFAVALTMTELLGCSSSSENGSNSTSMDELANVIEVPEIATQEKPRANLNVEQGTVGRSVSKPISLTDIRSILSPREVDVEILGIKSPEDITRIQTTFDKSMRENGQWFLAYVKSEARTGEALPYHPNFGITEDEYKRLGEFLKSFKLVPVAKGRLKFTAHSDLKTLIENVDGLREFDGIVIDFEHNQVTTHWGTASSDKPVHTDEQSALGRWDGSCWRLNAGTIESGSMTILEFDIGRQAATALNLMHLRAAVVDKGKKTVNVETIIRFPE